MAGGFRTPFWSGGGLGGGFAAVAPPVTAWTLGALWTNTTVCARSGTYGLQRTGDGVHGDSTVSTDPIDVEGGLELFAGVYVRASIGADGVIGFGFAYYDSGGILLSINLVSTSTIPTNWLQIADTFVGPAAAVIAIPLIRATGHFNGTWCVDTALVRRAGGQQNFKLSLLRHFWSEYVTDRGE